MSESVLIGLASVIILGIIAQWVAWRLRLPAILLLLLCGFVAGPGLGILHPDELFGDLLFPLVSISVAIILFEGGLSLRLVELRKVGTVVRNLTTIGILVTWVLSAAAAYLITGIDFPSAVLLGAILVVSGPTVIVPLIQQVRPTGRVGSIVKWEGIVNDPIGAILAVLVFEVIMVGQFGAGTGHMIWGAVSALVAGGVIGLLSAAIIVILLRRYLIPDFLQNAVALMLVIIAYVGANAVQSESGLLAVTVMGMALANQRYVTIKQITDFKETLRVILISSLFVILAARMSVAEIATADATSWIFVGVLIVFVRPVMAYLSTLKSNLNWRERAFVGWMAPRGIVAAAVVSVFMLESAQANATLSPRLAPLVFQTIIGTVAVYGLTVSPVARWLKLAQPNPQGVLFIGAHAWARAIAMALRKEGFEVALIDSNWGNITQARRAGCRAYYTSAISEHLHYDVPLDGIGRLVALTSNDEVNALAALHFHDIFDRSNVYQLMSAREAEKTREDIIPQHLRGRYLFSSQVTFNFLNKRFHEGAVIKRTKLTREYDYQAFRARYGESAILLFIIHPSGELEICSTEEPYEPGVGDVLIAMVDPVESSSPSKESTST